MLVGWCPCREDPPARDQFGDGKYNMKWTNDHAEYEQWWALGSIQTQQLARQLEEAGRPKSAARVRRVYAWHELCCMMASMRELGCDAHQVALNKGCLNLPLIQVLIL